MVEIDVRLLPKEIVKGKIKERGTVNQLYKKVFRKCLKVEKKWHFLVKPNNIFHLVFTIASQF